MIPQLSLALVLQMRYNRRSIGEFRQIPADFRTDRGRSAFYSNRWSNRWFAGL
jgi:hypothetical protein